MAETAPRAIGRGLAAILAVPGRGLDQELRDLPVDLIEPNPDQPRRRFDQEALGALAESVQERGVLQPILARQLPGGRYQLIAGERRWRAAQIAGLETLPAIVRPHDTAATLELALIENVARQDLNPVEQARACAALVEELGLTRQDVGRRIGRSRVAVSNLLRLLDLPDEVLALIEDGSLSEGHGRALLMARDHDVRRALARAAVARGWSVRELESRAREGAPKRRQRDSGVTLHPDLEHALEELAEGWSAAIKAEARAVPRGQGCRVELTFPSLDDARAALARLDGAAPA